MNKRPRLWPRIAVALVITLAAGVAWGIAMVWLGYLATQLWPSSETVYESVQVLDDGTPVIQAYSYQTVADVSFRRLDGSPVSVDNREWLQGASFSEPIRPYGVLEMPVSWRERIASSSNFQRPQIGWYLVRDDQPLGHAYLVGYDEASKLRVGYIGRSGFRPALPPQEEWFDLGRNRLDHVWGGGVCSSMLLQVGARAYTYPQVGGERDLPPWLLFLIDADRLLEIDLRARSVRTLLEAPGMLADAVVNKPLSATAETNAEQTNTQTTDEPTAAQATAAARRRRAPLPERVAVRMTDRIVILDPPTGAKREYVLPESLRETRMYVYAVGDDQLLIQRWMQGGYYGDTELTWLQPDGTIARQQSVALAYPAGPSEREIAWMAAPVAPSPIAWLFVLTVVAPLHWLQMHQVPTYSAGLARAFGVAGPPLVIVIAVGVALAWLTYRLQRRYRRPATGAWTTFVLLLGLPGFFAYWLEHRRPKLESCDSCGEIVPRDREACAACDAQFPTPPLVGTEIFA